MYEVFLELLANRQMTVAEFSRQTGIRQTTLSAWKTRRNMIGPKVGNKIAAFFGVSYAYLLGQTDAADAEPRPLYKSKEVYKLLEIANACDDEQIKMACDFLRRLSAYKEGLENVLSKDKNG